MTKSTKTWTLLALAILAAILLMLLLNRKKKLEATQTSVKIEGGVDTTTFPTRNMLNQALVRICSYDSGRSISLDPGAAGGRCAPVFTSIDGTTGYLLKDEIIVVPQGGQAYGIGG